MAKPNYQFEKRQRELAKKKKKEEKLQQRRSGAGTAEGDQPDDSGADAMPQDTAQPGQDNGAAPSATPENSA